MNTQKRTGLLKAGLASMAVAISIFVMPTSSAQTTTQEPEASKRAAGEPTSVNHERPGEGPWDTTLGERDPAHDLVGAGH